MTLTHAYNVTVRKAISNRVVYLRKNHQLLPEKKKKRSEKGDILYSYAWATCHVYAPGVLLHPSSSCQGERTVRLLMATMKQKGT